MDIFISWSGELSHKVALELKTWLSCVIQTVNPWVSSEDIEKGDRWFTEISQELERCNIGIICLTQDNFDKPWINFEAGALSKSLGKGKVCTLLFNIKPTDIKGPLAQFQATNALLKDDMQKLILTINNNLEIGKIPEDILIKVFGKWWDDFYKPINEMVQTIPVDKINVEIRSDKDLLEEVLANTRRLMLQQKFDNEFKFSQINDLQKKMCALMDKKIWLKSYLDEMKGKKDESNLHNVLNGLGELERDIKEIEIQLNNLKGL